MDELRWAEEVAEKITTKMRAVAERNRHKIPFKAVNGVYGDLAERNICWWTNGFWGGIMWQMYNATKDDLYREIALEVEKKLDKNLMDARKLDHDNGFKWLPTAVANYKLTGDDDGFNRGLLAACNLAGRFNPAGNFIRAWNGEKSAGTAIIDCMMNLPLLYWAYEVNGDPKFLQMATAHANTVKQYFVREDGSVNHIVRFDAVTGEHLEDVGGQGYAKGSSWTRGQSWALYGFVMSYIHTGDMSYLNTAKKVANYFIANIPENNLIPVDFKQPEDITWEDSSATVVAACGMLEIERQLKKLGELEQNESKVYHRAAMRLLTTLERERCNWDTNMDQIVEKCTTEYHGNDWEHTLVYADYYFIEAIWKLTGRELYIW